jgi:hypothetical protein
MGEITIRQPQVYSRRNNDTQADFVAAGDALTDGMNEFLNLLNDASPGAWNQGRINVLLTSTNVEFFVGNGRSSNKLGGTMTLYFLLAYHFGLLRLSGDPLRRYPGLSIIDLPPQLATTVARSGSC